jgi:hypothetical protein
MLKGSVQLQPVLPATVMVVKEPVQGIVLSAKPGPCLPPAAAAA